MTGDRRGLSLQQKLPLLIFAVLLALLGTCVALAYREVRGSAFRETTERLGGIARQVAALAQTGTVQRMELMRSVAADSTVQSAVAAGRPNDPKVVAALARLRVPADSGLPIELWNTRGERLAQQGDPVIWSRPEIAEPGAAPISGDSGGYHAFQTNEGRVYFWVTAPVSVNGEVVGHIAQLRRVGTRNTEESVGQLWGPDVRLFYVESPGQPWVSVGGRPMDAPTTRESFAPTARYTRAGQDMLGYLAHVEGTPWSIGVETPIAAVTARPTLFLRTITLIALALLAIGSLAAWQLARYVTTPLSQLTTAATSMAAGHYDQRIELDRSDELGEVSAAFDRMAEQVKGAITTSEESRQQAQTANRAKSEFLAMMSHEIRTPINAMIGYADLLEMGIGGPVNDEQQAQLGRIKNSGRHLIGLVDDVLDFAKIESGQLRMHPKPASASDAVETATSLLLPQAREKGVELTVDPIVNDLSYIGDPQRVEQILVNLISNAVKFTDTGGVVRVSASLEQAGNGGPAGKGPEHWAVITVKDNGIGIAEDQLRTIFDPFVQAERGYTRTRGGSGLGLTISQRLASMMGGDIVARSQPGRGSVFSLRLPASG